MSSYLHSHSAALKPYFRKRYASICRFPKATGKNHGAAVKKRDAAQVCRDERCFHRFCYAWGRRVRPVTRLFQDALQYRLDFFQRSVLFLDTLREAADNLFAHNKAGLPPANGGIHAKE